MAGDLKVAVDELAEQIGIDQRKQDKMLAKMMDPDAEALTGKALVIYASSTTKINGYLSQDPASNYEAGKPAGTLVDYILKDITFTLETPNTATAINAGGEGVLELHINGTQVDSFDLGAAFVAANEDSNQTWTPANSANGKITVVSVGNYNNFWQKVVARLNISPSDLRKGYNTITLKHTGAALNQVSQDFKVYNDIATNTPTVSIPTLAVHSKVSKWLSGVEYIGLNSVLKVGAVGSNLCDNSYVQDPLTLSNLTGAATTLVAPNDASVSGLSNPPSVGQTMTITDKLVTLNVANQCSADARVTVTPKRPSGSGTAQQSASQNLAVNTFGNRSTDTIEYFDDEQYREPLAGWDDESTAQTKTGNWDSTAALPANEAQVGIVAPNENGLVGIGEFKRRIYSGTTAKSSIQLTLAGTLGTLGQLGQGDTNVLIKLPGQSTWMDAIKPYGGDTNALKNTEGAGCMASISGNVINATFGTMSNFGSGYCCRIRIIKRTAASKPTQITTNW